MLLCRQAGHTSNALPLSSNRGPAHCGQCRLRSSGRYTKLLQPVQPFSRKKLTPAAFCNFLSYFRKSLGVISKYFPKVSMMSPHNASVHFPRCCSRRISEQNCSASDSSFPFVFLPTYLWRNSVSVTLKHAHTSTQTCAQHTPRNNVSHSNFSWDYFKKKTQ